MHSGDELCAITYRLEYFAIYIFSIELKRCLRGNHCLLICWSSQPSIYLQKNNILNAWVIIKPHLCVIYELLVFECDL